MRKAMNVTESCYKATDNFPTEEKYGLTSQLRRSTVSIPSNITKGVGRNTDGEFRQFLGNRKSQDEFILKNLNTLYLKS